jgi:hypothetical protein
MPPQNGEGRTSKQRFESSVAFVEVSREGKCCFSMLDDFNRLVNKDCEFANLLYETQSVMARTPLGPKIALRDSYRYRYVYDLIQF